MTNMHEKNSPKQSPEELTKYYLERLRLLRTTGASEDSVEIQNVYREILEHPPEHTVRLLSILTLRSQIQSSILQTHNEMDPLEDLGRFGDRIVELGERHIKPNHKSAEID